MTRLLHQLSLRMQARLVSKETVEYLDDLVNLSILHL